MMKSILDRCSPRTWFSLEDELDTFQQRLAQLDNLLLEKSLKPHERRKAESPNSERPRMSFLHGRKVGFIGTGNMAQAILKGLIDNGKIKPEHIAGANRSPGKIQKLSDQYGIQVKTTNEAVIDFSDIIIIGVKPQDFAAAIEPVASLFNPGQIVISLAAGIRLESLQKMLPQTRIIRLMPNTPSLIGKGVIGYLAADDDPTLSTVVEDLFSPLGYVLQVEDEDQFAALTVSCSSGTGFLFELMLYWQEWIEEHGFSPEVARQMTVETFLGASELAAQSRGVQIEELQSRVTSKKGVTFAGLSSMRELEVDRALRISFEKAAMRNTEMGKEFK